MSCGCSPVVYDDFGHVLQVETCPICLPAGAITWLIENGRQLDMFSDTQSSLATEGIVAQVDKLVSVSGSRTRTSPMLKDYMTQGLCTCDLPF